MYLKKETRRALPSDFLRLFFEVILDTEKAVFLDFLRLFSRLKITSKINLDLRKQK